MRRLVWVALALGVQLGGCAANCPQGAAAPRRCVDKAIPVGHWAGDWESYPLDSADLVRSGSIDLTIAPSGKLTGHTAEDDNPDTGTVAGSATAGGEFEAEAVVSRAGIARKYRMKGTFACDAEGFVGVGAVSFGDGGRGNVKFRVRDVP